MSDRDLADIEVLLIDGNNLLHRVSGSVEEGVQRQLLARLRGAVPTTLATVVMLDGHAAAGTSRTEKIGRGMEIRHSGSRSADDALLDIVDRTPFAERAAMTIVTDDRALTDRAKHLGARTQRLAWLERLMDLPTAGAATGGIGGGSVGSSRRARQQTQGTGGSPATTEGATDEDRPPWTPGRGATRKRGNPKRRSR
jgi:hypothetical protein